MVTVGQASSVVVRLSGAAGAELGDRAGDRHRVAGRPVGAVRVNTKMPSLVAGSASGFGSCNQKPVDDGR